MNVNGWSHILVVRLDNMGDVLMCTPAMQALREAHPHARITLLTSPAGARLAPHLDMVDGVMVHKASWVKQATEVEVDPELSLVAQLREARIDVAFILTTSTQSPIPMALLCRMAGIPQRIAHCRENPYDLLTLWIAESDVIEPGMRHEVQRQLDLIGLAGVPAPAEPRMRFALHEADKLRARELLQQAGVEAGRPYVVLHPGATAASRRYPPQDFGRALAMVAQEGWACVLSGGGDDLAALNEIRPWVPEAIDLGGKLSLGEMAALIGGAKLLIANNSGPMHIAAALGTPVVCLYALTNPQHTPWQVLSQVLFQDVACRGCLRSVCPQVHHACLRGVAPERVAQAALSLLAVREPVRALIEAHDVPYAVAVT